MKIFTNGFPVLFGIRFMVIGIAFFYKRVKGENARAILQLLYLKSKCGSHPFFSLPIVAIAGTHYTDVLCKIAALVFCC